VPDWAISEWPMREQPDELLAELYHAYAPLHQEETPDDPRPSLEADIAAERSMPAPEGGVVLVARDPAGEIAGWSRCRWEELPGWDHTLNVRVMVLPERRRQGLGRILLERSVAVAEARKLRLVIGRTRDTIPAGGAFCLRFGAKAVQTGNENRQDLHAVDRALVDRWLAEGPDRGSGYHLQFIAGSTPPELVGQVAKAHNALNTAPRDDLDVGDTEITPELVRQFEDSAAAAGDELWSYYAVHDDTGDFVGTTGIWIPPSTPDRVYVGATAVDPAHRGHALGKWLKAAMTERIVTELPAVRWVLTWNAESNDAMQSINRQLGFRPTFVSTTWQVATDILRGNLADGAPERRTSD
jgi:GNAT superfamily N-acetyltransferase